MTLHHRMPAALALFAAGALLAACSFSPRTRPLDVGDIEKSAESTQGVRRQLQGTWKLVSFETHEAGGQVKQHPAAGELKYDEYGNLVIRAALTDVPAGEQANLLRYEGRAVIDAPNRKLVLQGMQGQGGEALPAAVTANNVRFYEFTGDLLKLTTKDSDGKPTATITWKKNQ
jgi:hypothetical protein